MLRFVIYSVLLTLFVRALSRFWGGILEGASGRPPRSTNVPQRGVAMVRDPVCGTFVVPERALTVSDGRAPVYFCSAACRDQYRARSA